MKRYIALFSILLSCLCMLCGCAEKEEQEEHKELTGTWIIDFSESISEESDISSYEFLLKYRTSFLHFVSFYDDETYSATYDNIRKFTDIHSVVAPEEVHGSYSIVHDGTSISFDDSEYYNFELSGDRLVIWKSEDEKYVYQRDDSIEYTGMYKVTDGIETYAFYLRKDHLVELYSYFEDGTINYEDLYIPESPWRIEGDQFIWKNIEYPDIVMDIVFDGDDFILTSEDATARCERIDGQEGTR